MELPSPFFQQTNVHPFSPKNAMRIRRPGWESRIALLGICLAFLPSFSTAFYIPGVTPTSYGVGDLVPLHVNKIIPVGSENDQTLKSAVPYDYYNRLFHFCRPSEAQGGVRDGGPESLGAVIFGDRIQTSPFELKMMTNETCKKLCGPERFNPHGAQFFNKRIRQGYAYNWLVDGLPAGDRFIRADGQKFSTQGFPLGRYQGEEDLQVNNHYNIIIEYHPVGRDKFRVVGVYVQAESIKDFDETQPDCDATHNPMRLDEAGETDLTWSYSVDWRPSNVAWAVRWDMYLHVEDPTIHWFSLINSTVIVLFLVATVSTILTRALRKDFARYNRLDAFNLDDFSPNDARDDSVQEDSGWKLVHGDVFRPPMSPLLLSVFLGNGAQLFFMTGLTIAFALFGFSSPSNRGSIGTAILILYTFLGFVGGYVSARTYKTFGGESWKRNIIMTPVLVPGVVFATFFVMNFFLWIKQSSGAVPFTTMLVIVGLWFLITLPLSISGSWLGLRQAVSYRSESLEAYTDIPSQALKPPVRTNQIPRQIPPTHTYLKPTVSLLWVGALPFGAIFIELFFIMNNIWIGRIYYMFGFLFLCYGIMVITCAAVTIMFVYYLLCAENYRWQWRAFNSAGAGAGYVFLFSIIYAVAKFKFGGVTSVILYLGYSALLSFLFYIMTGKFLEPRFRSLTRC